MRGAILLLALAALASAETANLLRNPEVPVQQEPQVEGNNAAAAVDAASEEKALEAKEKMEEADAPAIKMTNDLRSKLANMFQKKYLDNVGANHEMREAFMKKMQERRENLLVQKEAAALEKQEDLKEDLKEEKKLMKKKKMFKAKKAQAQEEEKAGAEGEVKEESELKKKGTAKKAKKWDEKAFIKHLEEEREQSAEQLEDEDQETPVKERTEGDAGAWVMNKMGKMQKKMKNTKKELNEENKENRQAERQARREQRAAEKAANQALREELTADQKAKRAERLEAKRERKEDNAEETRIPSSPIKKKDNKKPLHERIPMVDLTKTVTQ